MVVQIEGRPVSDSFCEQFAKLGLETLSENLVVRVRTLLQNPPNSMGELCQQLQKLFNWQVDSPYSIHFSSWDEHKKSQPAETMQELDRVRNDANSRINELAAQTGRQLGFQEVSWRICGTSGYDSDVDITASTPANNIEELVLYKLLRDCIHFCCFGGTSGKQFDTECYMPHIAEFDLLQYVSPADAINAEKAAVVLQRYVSLQFDRDLYERTKHEDIEAITDPAEKELMQRLHLQVEALMSYLKGVGGCEKISISAKLAAFASHVQEKIAHATRLGNETDLAALQLKLHALLLVLAVLQVGGTFSVGEGKVTLLHAGGQVCDHEVNKRKNSLTKCYERKSDEVLESCPQIRRKASLSLLGTLHHSDEIARYVLQEEIVKLLNPPFEASTFQNLIIAAYEEAQQLKAALYHDMDAIRAGKYALRVTRHLHQALKQCEQPPQIFLKQAERLERISNNLEKCKRKQALSSEIATLMLSEEIGNSLAKRGSADFTRIKSFVSHMFADCDAETRTQKEHLNFLKKTLIGAKDFFVDLQKPEIHEILVAHAGYGCSERIYNDAVRLTLQDLNVEQFFSEVVTLGRNMREYARRKGLLPPSKPEMAKPFDFVALLKEAGCFLG
ncbi:MAG: hypothetical protein JSR37_07455 [Verrucomicrobia bacterium]|nr:hypothetical protein [Verrucomicrobiota bacterium]MBS0636163.1 hypothetical protein [Verrucomicrobiota bacterium]